MNTWKMTIPCLLIAALIVMQVQPWFLALKPLGPSVVEQREALKKEERAIGMELRTWRTIAKVRGYFHRDNGYELMLKEDPGFAAFDKRRNEFQKRIDAFHVKHPDLGGW